MPAVMILGARAPVALDHARRFARQGWKVFVADSVPCRTSGWSKAVSASIALPPPRDAPLDFGRALAEAARRHRVDLVLPTCEEVFYVSRYRELLPPTVAVATDHIDKLRTLHSKLAFLEIARGCGANVPDSAGVSSIGEARDWARGRPAVLKPEYSRFGVHVHLYPDGIPGDAAPLAAQGRWVAQEYCDGEEICSYSVAVSGKLTAHVAYRPRYRMSRSSSYYFEPMDVPTIRWFVEKLVAKIGYTGQISFDWILGSRGTCTVLECNPRAISGVHLFGAADELPRAFLGDLQNVVEPRVARPRMLAPLMLTVGLVGAIRNSRVTEWRHDYARANDVFLEPGDRMPMLGCVRDFGSHSWRALRKHCTVREATTRDIEWDGEVLPEC